LLLQAYLIAFDHKTEDKYFNRFDSVRYDSRKPTPNTLDFPIGLLEGRAIRYMNILQKMFTSD